MGRDPPLEQATSLQHSFSCALSILLNERKKTKITVTFDGLD